MGIGRFRALRLLLLAGIVACASGERLPAASQADAGKVSIQERLSRVRADLFSNAARVNEDIRELREILGVDPSLAEGHLLLGLAYRSLGSAELMGEAVAELRQALALDPGFVPARLYLAHLYIDLRRVERAREELDAALVQLPGHPQVLALLGEVERQLGNPRRSLEVNRQALKADESFVEARYYVGLALLDLGQRDEAIRELERVVRSDPKRAEVHLSLGAAYLDAGRLDEALKALRQGTQIAPARADIRVQLARAYRSKGLLTKAEEQLKLAVPEKAATLGAPLDQHLESDLYLERGLLRLQQGRLEAAAEAFRKVLEMDPNNGAANRGLAEVRGRKTGRRN
jgi:tetratricopeptide (TPR) repeat protein